MRNENIAVNPAAETGPLTRRRFMGVAAMLAPGFCAMSPEGTALPDATTKQANLDEHNLIEEIKKEKIRRAMLAGPSMVTAEATVAEMDRQGNLTVLRPGTNEWVCIPGDQNIVGKVDMALDPMGLVWFKDLLARKPKPTNTSPGLIYMLNGATQRSFTLGIAQAPAWLFAAELREGTVIRLLTAFERTVPILAVRPASRRASTKVRIFIEHLEKTFALCSQFNPRPS